MLRCFRSEDCRTDAEALVQAINGALRTPAVTLDDFSARYGSSTPTQARHYKLWFAPGPIELSGQ